MPRSLSGAVVAGCGSVRADGCSLWINGVSGRRAALRALRKCSHINEYAALFEFARALPDNPNLVSPKAAKRLRQFPVLAHRYPPAAARGLFPAEKNRKTAVGASLHPVSAPRQSGLGPLPAGWDQPIPYK
jgi:hypothetical protein